MLQPDQTKTRAVDPRSDAFVTSFGSFLLDGKILDELAVRRAQRAVSQSGERFDVVLIRLGLLSDSLLAKAFAEFYGLRLASPDDFPETALLADIVPFSFLKANRLLPIEETAERLDVAVANPFNLDAIAALAFMIERPVDFRIAAEGDIDSAITRLYGAGVIKSEAVDRPEASGRETAIEDDVRRLEDMASEAPVIRLVHDLIVRGVDQQASDIHIEPREDSVRVRFRIDGALHLVETLGLALRAAIGSRIKIMARLNIAERRLPQDGRIKVNVRGREIDLRVSTMPTLWGESLVLRILDRASVELDFLKLGFSGSSHQKFSGLLAEPNGIILVTGPTGSGKTTTLYTALKGLNSVQRKIFTVEDPIEYQLPGINQIQVHPKIGLTFATSLRSILRQDPDIIMVGEMRDLETAQVAIQASLTGHLVLSTVHTNSAAATITRLLDMGVEKYLLASCLKGVVAQRLVRRLCEACAKPVTDTKAALGFAQAAGIDIETALGGEAPRLRKAVGCPACRQTGFAGRTTIFEILSISHNVRSAILASSPERTLEVAGVADGMHTLLQNGLTKALCGETTPEEVLRVTRFEECQDTFTDPTINAAS